MKGAFGSELSSQVGVQSCATVPTTPTIALLVVVEVGPQVDPRNWLIALILYTL